MHEAVAAIIRVLLDSGPETATILAGLGSLFAVLGKRFALQSASPSLTIADEATPYPGFRAHIDARLAEARKLAVAQTRIAAFYGVAHSSLTFGQYIIGAVLASSFVQQTMSKDVIGGLGVVVLVASIMQERYHPGTAERAAKDRASRLRATIRETEDALINVHATQPTPEYSEIVQKLSRDISIIESEQPQDDIEPHRPQTGRKKKRQNRMEI